MNVVAATISKPVIMLLRCACNVLVYLTILYLNQQFTKKHWSNGVYGYQHLKQNAKSMLDLK